MAKVLYSVVDRSKGDAKVTEKGNTFVFGFPCADRHDCTAYSVTLSPGKYRIELFGASGGFSGDRISLFRNDKSTGCIPQKHTGNTICRSYESMAGAGGYSSGILILSKVTQCFLSIGGQGSFGNKLPDWNSASCYLPANMQRGGFNGGGSSSNAGGGTGSGGGATDFRILKNDLYHRVIVAGGGGGTDNPGGTIGGSDDGSGGAGGGLQGQGFRIDGNLEKVKLAKQESGFSFGNGESAQEIGSKHPEGIKVSIGASDRSGGGGGWFGGFSSHHGNGGGGGGSSYILTKDSYIPSSPITVYSEFFDPLYTDRYAFDNNSPYRMSFPEMSSGIWTGNGQAKITFIHHISHQIHASSYHFGFCIIALICHAKSN